MSGEYIGYYDKSNISKYTDMAYAHNQTSDGREQYLVFDGYETVYTYTKGANDSLEFIKQNESSYTRAIDYDGDGLFDEIEEQTKNLYEQWETIYYGEPQYDIDIRPNT